MAKQILHGEESRQAILRGVNTLADAVKATLGPIETEGVSKIDTATISPTGTKASVKNVPNARRTPQQTASNVAETTSRLPHAHRSRPCRKANRHGREKRIGSIGIGLEKIGRGRKRPSAAAAQAAGGGSRGTAQQIEGHNRSGTCQKHDQACWRRVRHDRRGESAFGPSPRVHEILEPWKGHELEEVIRDRRVLFHSPDQQTLRVTIKPGGCVPMCSESWPWIQADNRPGISRDPPRPAAWPP